MHHYTIKIKNILYHWYLILEKKSKDSEPQMIAFGIFGVINYPLFYLIWSSVSRQPYENLYLRLFIGLLCLLLILKNYWPEKLKPILPIYWYLTLFISLPFFCTYMFLVNHGSTGWIMNGMLVLFLLILLVDWVSFAWLLVLGIAAGTFAYYLLVGSIFINEQNLFGTISSYILAIIIGIAFSRNIENRQLKKQLNNMNSLSASIAHELRTPLAAINAGANAVKESIPALIVNYNQALDNNVRPGIDLEPEDIDSALQNIIEETKYSNTIINMLLVNVDRSAIKTNEFEKLSISNCIKEAIRRYPFLPSETNLVKFEDKNDFYFRGKSLLTIHILFNLLKNALYYIKAAGKGDIKIWLTFDDKYNILHFKDTGPGISAKILPLIFELFFSDTYHGSGVGLAFCKMVMEAYSGNISCDAKEGEYTEFKLAFPKIDQ